MRSVRATALLVAAGAAGCQIATIVPPDDAGGADGALKDATTTDAPRPDAPLDAPGDARFCSTVDAAFCADFDIPGDAGAGFSAPSITPPANLLFETTNVMSPPVSVEVDLPADGGSGFAYLSTQIPVPMGASRLQLDMDVQLATPPAPAPQIPVFLFGEPGRGFELTLVAGKYALVQALSSSPVDLSASPPTNEWIHAHMDIVLSATSGSASLIMSQVGGAMIATASISSVQTEDMPPSSFVALEVGGGDTVTPSAALIFRYDNAVVRFQ